MKDKVISDTRAINAIEKLVKGMCAFPKDCHFDVVSDGAFPELIIRPHGADHPIVCGKAGAVIDALKYIGREIGVQVTLQGSNMGERWDNQGFKPNHDFDEYYAIGLFREFAEMLFPNMPEVRTSKRQNELRIELVAGRQVVEALSNIFYPFGYRQGCKMKVRLPRVEKSRA